MASVPGRDDCVAASHFRAVDGRQSLSRFCHCLLGAGDHNRDRMRAVRHLRRDEVSSLAARKPASGHMRNSGGCLFPRLSGSVRCEPVRGDASVPTTSGQGRSRFLRSTSPRCSRSIRTRGKYMRPGILAPAPNGRFRRQGTVTVTVIGSVSVTVAMAVVVSTTVTGCVTVTEFDTVTGATVPGRVTVTVLVGAAGRSR